MTLLLRRKRLTTVSSPHRNPKEVERAPGLSRRRRGMLICAIAVCSTAAGMAAALKGPADAGVSAESLRRMLAGLSEAWIPLFVAFAFLSVAWLLVAVGLRRQE